MRTRTIGNQSVGTSEVGAIGLGLMTFDQTGTQPREQLDEPRFVIRRRARDMP